MNLEATWGDHLHLPTITSDTGTGPVKLVTRPEVALPSSGHRQELRPSTQGRYKELKYTPSKSRADLGCSHLRAQLCMTPRVNLQVTPNKTLAGLGAHRLGETVDLTLETEHLQPRVLLGGGAEL